jgi:hypothetical protein
MERLEGLGKLKKFNDLIGTRARDLPACSTAPQPPTLPLAPISQPGLSLIYRILDSFISVVLKFTALRMTLLDFAPERFYEIVHKPQNFGSYCLINAVFKLTYSVTCVETQNMTNTENGVKIKD